MIGVIFWSCLWTANVYMLTSGPPRFSLKARLFQKFFCHVDSILKFEILLEHQIFLKGVASPEIFLTLKSNLKI